MNFVLIFCVADFNNSFPSVCCHCLSCDLVFLLFSHAFVCIIFIYLNFYLFATLLAFILLIFSLFYCLFLN